MSRDRWTAADDEQFRDEAQVQAITEAVLPVVARMLGVDHDQIQVTHQIVRPCGHWRCRLTRWWKRVAR